MVKYMAKIPGYYDANDVSTITGMSESWAQKKIKQMNKGLEELDQFVIPGKVPEELFHDKFPYIKKASAATDANEKTD